MTPSVLTALKSNNIENIDQLVQKTPKELLSIPRLGAKTLTRIIEKLAERGLSLNMNQRQITEASALEIIKQIVTEITEITNKPKEAGKQQASATTITKEEVRNFILKISQPVDTLLSSTYVLRTLRTHKLYTIRDLIRFTPQELSEVTSLRVKPISKIRKALQKKGLDLGQVHIKSEQMFKALNEVLNKHPKYEKILF